MRKLILTAFALTLFTAVCWAEKTVKVLAIGNRVTGDAFNEHIIELAKADGKNMVIATLTIPSNATLKQHVRNARSNAAYHYLKTGTEGDTVDVTNKTVADAIAAQPWDYIVFQQQSFQAGKIQSFCPAVQELRAFAQDNSTNHDVTYCLFQVWAYANGFERLRGYYGNTQRIMFNAVTDATNRAGRLVNPPMRVIPAGTAIQNARTSIIADNFTEDGYHLNEIGAFTAASAIYEFIFNSDITKNSYMPDNLPEQYAIIAKRAARAAVTAPNSITRIAN